jgi:hypothetical protein
MKHKEVVRQVRVLGDPSDKTGRFLRCLLSNTGAFHICEKGPGNVMCEFLVLYSRLDHNSLQACD